MNQDPLATREQIALSFFNVETAIKYADRYATVEGKRKEIKRQIKAAWEAAEIWEDTRSEIISSNNNI